MEEKKIVELGELLKDFLGPNKTVIDHEAIRLTALGENYGSTMLALKIQVENGTKTEEVEVVAKIPPPGEFIKRMFNIPVTFRYEINFYKIIVPELKLFLKERNVESEYLDCFPEYYGSRISLSNKEFADDDAVLLLENLKLSDYEGIDRVIGFDLDTTKVILKAFAKFHAVPIAMKLSTPETFHNKIKSLFTPFKVFSMPEKMISEVQDKIAKMVEDIDDCKEYSSKVRETLNSSDQFWTEPKNSAKYTRETYATIIHTDAWVNNFMVQFSNGAPSKAKIVDFQLYEYGSAARDIVFFIFSSVQMSVIQQHFDDLIALYHASFVEVLQKLNCDASQFSREEFIKEMELVSKQSEFAHCMIMLDPIFATQDSVKELDQYVEDDMTRPKPVPQKQKERASFIVNEFIKKNFI